ncbi:hypothetical protein Hypma_013855 [Hypsizygus marmoreus]|uniref:Ubiquitin-like protease family profile domain-containing protein n=1 Tax=Hypsizygus marmoreus TaxID=39966 RepID=A0A369KFV0_HYPMA|nr:hypothetical protein Hypma_013855 [Hypsizygus marmoreus]
MSTRPGARREQPCTGGLGRQFTTPPKRRDPKKTQDKVIPGGHIDKRRRLEESLAALKAKARKPTVAESDASPVIALPEATLNDPFFSGANLATQDDGGMELNQENATSPQITEDRDDISESPNKRRTVPDQNAYTLYDRWSQVLPDLVEPLLTYIARTSGKRLESTPNKLRSHCRQASCKVQVSHITCLHFDHFDVVEVHGCACQSVIQVLIANGLFPTAPIHPRQAVAVGVLDLYQALFERSCDAINAMAAALNAFYTRRGFVLLNVKGQPIKDPFRRGLGYAVQWYDNLLIKISRRVDDALLAAGNHILLSKLRDEPSTDATLAHQTPSLVPPLAPLVITPNMPPCDVTPVTATTIESPTHAPQTPTTKPPISKTRTLPNGKTAPALTPGKCARILEQRCPACFGGTLFGRNFRDEGGDIAVSLDGNFNHRHLRTAGDSPKFYDPTYMIPKEEVDRIGDHIETLRKKPPKPYTPKVPDEAVDDCQNSYTAGNGANSKTNMEKFDDGGLMAITCRHDIPLFFANIDTPGEQQKYAVALISRLFALLPPDATVAALYDVGCVLDRSLQTYDFLPIDYTSRLQIATAAMHAYGHDWACQLVYNPRLRPGLGLSDGEGVERLWSRFRKLIGITRSSARSRRIWLIDRQAAAIGAELRDDLGDWIRRRLTKGVHAQGAKAQATLDTCGVPIPELRRQWVMQQESQLSLRAHAPARLKKELDTVLNLQGDLDAVDVAIQATHSVLSQCSPSKESLKLIKTLQTSHDDLQEQVETLYASLNVQDSFPELEGVDLEFIRTLILARDLKINIRKRCIGSFFEWDKLDQAVGGRDQSIGTKLHQHTRKAISKRKPALMNSIRKFNKYCEKLAELHQPEWSIPLPEPLPTQLSPLRDCHHLMQDVWIAPTTGEVPRWLEDLDVREGIRAMLKLDRCQEELRRLGMEADNICRWFGNELCAVEVAIGMPDNLSIKTQLLQYRQHLLYLKPRWTNAMASEARFDSHVAHAQQLSQSLSNPSTEPSTELNWLAASPSNYGISQHLVNPTHFRAFRHFGTTQDINHHSPSAPPQDTSGPSQPPTEITRSITTRRATPGSSQISQSSNPDDESDDELEFVGEGIDPSLPTSEEVLLGDYYSHTGELDEDPTAGRYPNYTEGAPLDIQRTPPEHLRVDPSIETALDFQHVGDSSSSLAARALHRGARVIVFDKRELEILSHPTARLNDVCLNGGAALLQDFLSHPSHESSRYSQSCAIFTTFDLNMVRCVASYDQMWRRTSASMYWLRDVWILPIHRRSPSEHWVLCVIYPEQRRLHLFDSLAENWHWKHEVPSIMNLITSLVINANRHGHHLPVVVEEGWTAVPLTVRPVQTNGYDCGLWVLAAIAGVLRGYHAPRPDERVMQVLRDILRRRILGLPLYRPLT